MPATTICFVLPSFGVGGAEYATVRLIRALTARGFRLTAIVTREPGPLADMLPSGVRVLTLGIKRTLLSALGLTKAIRSARADVVVPVMGGTAISVCLAALWLRLLGAAPPVVPILHTSVCRKDSRRHTRWLYATLNVALLWLCERIVCVSDAIRLELGAACPWLKGYLVTVPNVICDVAFMEQVQAARASIQGQSGMVTLVACGRLIWAKGFDVFLRAFGRLQAGRWRAVIIGDGPERARLERIACELGIDDRVEFSGSQTNPLPLIASATAFVHSSRYDALPTVVVEAMALGVPAIVTDSAGGAAEVIRFGSDGVLVPPSDERALAEAIDNLVNDPARQARLAAAGLERAKDYTEQEVVGKYCALLAEVSAASRGRSRRIRASFAKAR